MGCHVPRSSASARRPRDHGRRLERLDARTVPPRSASRSRTPAPTSMRDASLRDASLRGATHEPHASNHGPWRCSSLVTRNMQIKPFDWTFTTTYKGSATVRSRSRSRARAPAMPCRAMPRHAANPSCKSEQQRGEPAATKDTELAIDYERLKRPDPILYFAEVVLFEDELADNGISSLSVKLVRPRPSSRWLLLLASQLTHAVRAHVSQRVMPTCFFILQRQWIRVDDVMFRVVDTRFYHQFGTQHVLREYQMREGTFAALADVRLDRTSTVLLPPSSALLATHTTTCARQPNPTAPP